MKRAHTVSDVKAATPSVEEKLDALKNELEPEDAEALAELVDIANQQAIELSKDELAVVAAGFSAKPMSKHA